MRILGIDAGLATTGFGVIEQKGKRIKLIDFGWIQTPKTLSPGKRLISVRNQLWQILRRFHPDVVVMEKLFFYNNAKTAMGVSEAMGVIRLVVTEAGIPLVEYPPLKIKAVVTTNGRAKKGEMQEIVQKLLGVEPPAKKKTYFDDVTDALGAAICHAKLLAKEGR